MRILSSAALTLTLLAGSAFGASKEMQELQRDIAQLQSQLQALQSSQDQKLAAIQALVTQSLDAAGKANTAVSVLAATVNQTLERELKSQMTPVAGLAAKVDNTNNDVAEVRNQVSDLNLSMNKVLQRLGDISDAIKVIQAPAAAPPTAGTGATSAPPPAAVLYQNAYRDQDAGKYDLALSGFTDFLKFYPEDPNAPRAQFNIGEAHRGLKKFDLAAQDYDAVIERYPSSDITPDAYLSKGIALREAGRKSDSAATFRALIANFSRSSQAAKARDELRALGLSATGPTPAKSPVRRAK
jgi:tol-pal system protein YbgF